MDYTQELKNILAKRNVDVEHLTNDAVLANIGLDSLDLVEIMLEIEELVNTEFTSEEIMGLTTIQDVINLIDSKVK
ncbi:MAG: acyl carrier protein [Bacilli bacterium]